MQIIFFDDDRSIVKLRRDEARALCKARMLCERLGKSLDDDHASTACAFLRCVITRYCKSERPASLPCK